MLENAAPFKIELSAVYLVAVRTGPRLGELLALVWTDIHFDNRTVEVSKSNDHRLKKIEPTKSRKRRTLDLTPVAVDALPKLRPRPKVAKISGAVFTNARGEKLHYLYLHRKLKEIGSRPIRFHDLRHTYATLRIAKGDNIVDVSKQLGHHASGSRSTSTPIGCRESIKARWTN